MNINTLLKIRSIVYLNCNFLFVQFSTHESFSCCCQKYEIQLYKRISHNNNDDDHNSITKVSFSSLIPFFRENEEKMSMSLYIEKGQIPNLIGSK